MKNLNDILTPDSHGCWIDGGHHSGDYLSYHIIKLAHEYGYDVDMEQVEKDMADYDNLTYEIQGDISQGLWEESALAIDYLNDQINDPSFYFFVDDNSLYLEWNDEEGTEYNLND